MTMMTMTRGLILLAGLGASALADTPAPAAIRRLRDALSRSGLLRSTGVIELMMPSMRRN